MKKEIVTGLKLDYINLDNLKTTIFKCIKNESIRNCNQLNFFRLFLHQIYVYLRNCESVFLEPENNSILEHLNDEKDVKNELDYVRRTINQVLNRYFITQIHAVIEQTFKEYIETQKIPVQHPIKHEKNSCEFQGCCFYDKQAKAKNIIFFSSKVMKHNEIQKVRILTKMNADSTDCERCSTHDFAGTLI